MSTSYPYNEEGKLWHEGDGFKYVRVVFGYTNGKPYKLEYDGHSVRHVYYQTRTVMLIEDEWYEARAMYPFRGDDRTGVHDEHL